MSATVLAFGASGRNAGYVVRALADKGAAVRGFVRDGKGGEAALANGASETVEGDLADRRSIEKALSGIDRVFYLAPAFLKDEADTGQAVVEACRAAGARRFVFSSVFHPELSSLVNHAAKPPVEEAVLESGMDYTFLHPALFFQNLASSWESIAKDGLLAEPWSIETRFSRVDYRDVAEVAAIALTEDRLLQGTFELAADGWLDRRDVAALAGRVLGRPVHADLIDPASVEGASPAMRAMFEHYDHTGLLANPLTLRAILGREPRSLEAFFRELAAGGSNLPNDI